MIANHFYTLLDILLSTGKNQNIELTPSIVTKVFRALEWGILGEEVGRSTCTFLKKRNAYVKFFLAMFSSLLPWVAACLALHRPPHLPNQRRKTPRQHLNYRNPNPPPRNQAIIEALPKRLVTHLTPGSPNPTAPMKICSTN